MTNLARNIYSGAYHIAF